MHDARELANYLIEKGFNQNTQLTPLQVIKLSYLSSAWWLAYNDDSLIYQNIEAWTYGPVISDIYHSLKSYGNKPVTQLIPGVKIYFSEEEKNIIDQVFKIYKDWTGGELSALTHEKGTPWSQVYTSKNTNVIPTHIIQSFYRNKIREQ